MKALLYVFRLVFILLLLLVTIEVCWRLLSPGQRNYLLHQIPAEWRERYSVSPQTPSLLQLSGARIVIPERSLQALPGDPSAEGVEQSISVHLPGLDGSHHPQAAGCMRPDQIKPPKPKAKPAGVYRWVDDKGRVHFGDKPTETAEDLSQHYKTRNAGMKLVLSYPDWAGDSSVQATLEREAELMYRIFSRLIPKPQRRPVTLNITLFENQTRYATYRTQEGISSQTGAFYRASEHRIYMPRYASDSQTRAVARHEMTHAMTVAMLGSLPVWLMEGIAEYMERLQWQLSAARVPVDRWALNQIRQGQTKSLGQLTGMSHQDFYARQRHRNYALASLLVHFLMEHTEGKAWLTQMLARYAAQPCLPFDPQTAFEQTYPGGLSGLSSAFETWLSAREHLPHRY